MELDLTTTAAGVQVKWKGLADGAWMGKILLASLRRIGLQLQRTVMGHVSNDLLHVRTGTLRRAVFYRVETSGRDALVRVGADLTKAPYGRIQNVGGEVRPVRSQFLTIPLEPNLTGNGVMRVNAREFIANPGSIGFTGSFVTRLKTAIMGVRPDGSVEPVFALVKSVRIKPTGYIAHSLTENKQLIQEESDILGDELTKELAR